MPFNANKRSPFRYVLLVFLILILFLFAFFSYLRTVKANEMKANVAEFIKLNEDYSKIDSCIHILYNAENNSRLYALTADKNYIIEFSAQIQNVSAYIADIKSESEHRREKVRSLINKKEVQTRNYLQLRKLSDSLVVNFLKLGLMDKMEEPKMVMPSIKKSVKQTVKLDTIRRNPSPKKKFFGRLAEAFSGKAATDSSFTIIKTEVKEVGNEELEKNVRAYNEKQLKGIREYYKQLYNNSNRLRNEEKSILLLNTKLIAEIVSILRTYKMEEIAYVNRAKALMINELQLSLKSLDEIGVFNALLLVSVIVVILYKIIKMFEHEKALVGINKSVSQEAQSKSRFLANMSHEIRTPLNSIVGFSEQLSSSNLNNEQSDQVKAIRDSSKMLLEVVNEILDFSKFEVGKINFEIATFSPKAEILEVFNSMNVLANEKQIELINKITLDDNVFLMGDRFRLKQVVMNLLTNAIKFTSVGHVILDAYLVQETKKKQCLLRVFVEDTGIGMAKPDLDIIFDEFSQIKSSSSTAPQGTGLGLAICKKIVELQGGEIMVASTLGRGSVFSFEIPYERSESGLEDKKQAIQSTGSGNLEGKKILLVDDNKMNVLLAQTILKKWNVSYDSAYDGKMALEMFKRNNYDLVLTDIQMPVMGGVELTHEIRYNGDFAKSGVPILGITAHVMQENRDIYLKAGMNDLVLKPFLEMELINQITKYI